MLPIFFILYCLLQNLILNMRFSFLFKILEHYEHVYSKKSLYLKIRRNDKITIRCSDIIMRKKNFRVKIFLTQFFDKFIEVFYSFNSSFFIDSSWHTRMHYFWFWLCFGCDSCAKINIYYTKMLSFKFNLYQNYFNHFL